MSRPRLDVPGAGVLGTAFTKSESHQKLLVIILPSGDVGEDDAHQLTGKQESGMRTGIEGQFSFERGKRWWSHVQGLECVGSFCLFAGGSTAGQRQAS